MPSGFDDYVDVISSSVLGDALREYYLPQMVEGSHRAGYTTNRIFNPKTQKIDGDGMNVQKRIGALHSASVSRNFYADPVQSRSYAVGKFKARFNPEEPSENDFTTIDNATEFGLAELERKANGKAHSLGDFVAEIGDQMLADDSETMAKYRNLPQSGQIGAIATGGGLVADDDITYEGASSFSSGATGRIKLTSATPIAMFPRDVLIDVIDSDGSTLNHTLIVNDANPEDNSIGVQAVNSKGERDDSGTIAAATLAAGDLVYFHGGLNNGAKSLGAWMVPNGESSESFFTVDRSVPTNRWMLPVTVGPAASQTLEYSHLRSLGYALQQKRGKRFEKPEYIFQLHPKMLETYIDVVNAETILTADSTSRGKRMLEHGFQGIMHQDPYFGRVGLEPDEFCPNDRIRAILLGTWMTLHPMSGIFKMLEGHSGYLYRKASSTADGTLSKIYRTDRTGTFCDVCTDIDLNGLVRNVASLS
jgi:hypothetical protein